MELPLKLHQEIEVLSRSGSDLFDEGHYDAAIEKWQHALDLVPPPKADWEATLWLCASIGDAQYQKGDFASARELFLDAINAPNGTSNPFVLYRLGQTEAHLGNAKASTDYLLRAYMLDGTKIFKADAEGASYLKILEAQGLLP